MHAFQILNRYFYIFELNRENEIMNGFILSHKNYNFKGFRNENKNLGVPQKK